MLLKIARFPMVDGGRTGITDHLLIDFFWNDSVTRSMFAYQTISIADCCGLYHKVLLDCCVGSSNDINANKKK